mmetsp:Transcript_19248/g.38926  ORF Transcript_19248/g.38926 Transcript_19248/m.38926 type:complete len:1095 (+) Transcript_19248:117-3401(+)|eukprot:CAMPEP_0167776696 /NCGR_PEP_ID=MMETSP0111_2-20121227/3269_1 /TAXON_ID=91324 /ORGANISM="Lotharella globosa, Strain CCCM811" /LENGTH=1094 /DNA_ID=CAMNT_0007666773 /DNA_START=38 /DNA_END=3322 /DNA_ORIENTATION=+
MGNVTNGPRSLLYGGDKLSTLLCDAFVKFAEAGIEADHSERNFDEEIKILARNQEGPFRGLHELFLQHCQTHQKEMTKDEFIKMMKEICTLSEDWFPAYIATSRMSEQHKMEIIDHFEANFERIGGDLHESMFTILEGVEKKSSELINWEEFSAKFFGIALKTIQTAQTKAREAQKDSEAQRQHKETKIKTEELNRIFQDTAKDAERVRSSVLIDAMRKAILSKVVSEGSDIELHKVFRTLFEHLETTVVLDEDLNQEEFRRGFIQNWVHFSLAAERLRLFPRNNYVEIYDKYQSRWKLGIVKRIFISEDCRIWLRLYIPGSSDSKSINIMDDSCLKKIQWTRGRKVEVKDGNHYYPGNVILNKKANGTEWVGLEYMTGNTIFKRVKVDTKYCPKLFRPVQDPENGIRFGYSVTLSSVFFDVKMSTYRYILHVKGPEKSWRVAKNFSLIRTFWNTIKKLVTQKFPGIQFPKGKLIGCHERGFIRERREALATFWRRLTRMLHLIDDTALEKVAFFLEIPFVSQKQYKKQLARKTYIRLLRCENLPMILDDQGKPKQTCAYVRMSICEDAKGSQDVEEWTTKRDSENPAWNATRALATNGSKLTIEVWQDNFGKIPDLKVAKLVVGLRHLMMNQKSAISLPVSTKVKPNPRGVCRVVLQRVPEPPKEKWVYLIRHGQSKWNAAKRDFDLLTAFGIIDHGLTKKGADQAASLREKIRSEKFISESKTNPMYSHFYKADKVFSSPLTRAVESAVLALRDHDSVSSNGILLMADAREKRTMMGMDCTGQFRGKEIVTHIHNEFKQIFNGEVKDDIKKVKVDPNDSIHFWWNTKGESSSGFAERIDNVMKNLMYEDSSAMILVCHSMVIRHIFKTYIHPDFKRGDEVTAYALGYEKLDNMGIAGFRMDRTKLQCITEAQLLFDSKVLYNKKTEHRRLGSRKDLPHGSPSPPPEGGGGGGDKGAGADLRVDFESLVSPIAGDHLPGNQIKNGPLVHTLDEYEEHEPHSQLFERHPTHGVRHHHRGSQSLKELSPVEDAKQRRPLRRRRSSLIMKNHTTTHVHVQEQDRQSRAVRVSRDSLISSKIDEDPDDDDGDDDDGR